MALHQFVPPLSRYPHFPLSSPFSERFRSIVISVHKGKGINMICARLPKHTAFRNVRCVFLCLWGRRFAPSMEATFGTSHSTRNDIRRVEREVRRLRPMRLRTQSIAQTPCRARRFKRRLHRRCDSSRKVAQGRAKASSGELAPIVRLHRSLPSFAPIVHAWRSSFAHLHICTFAHPHSATFPHSPYLCRK